MTEEYTPSEEYVCEHTGTITVRKDTEETPVPPVEQTVKTPDMPILTVAPIDDLKAKLLAVLQEDPGTAKVTENPWLHDVFVRKIRALVE